MASPFIKISTLCFLKSFDMVGWTSDRKCIWPAKTCTTYWLVAGLVTVLGWIYNLGQFSLVYLWDR